MSASEQHTASIFRVDWHEDKGSMFCEDEDSSHMRCDAVPLGQEFMMIERSSSVENMGLHAPEHSTTSQKMRVSGYMSLRTSHLFTFL